MPRLTIFLACAAVAAACGDATGTEGLAQIPINTIVDACGNPQVFTNLAVYGPPGSTASNPLPGRWVARGSYDLRGVAVAGTGTTVENASITMGFLGQMVLDDDANEPFQVTADNLAGDFQAAAVLDSASGGLTPMVWAETAGEVYLSCAQLH